MSLLKKSTGVDPSSNYLWTGQHTWSSKKPLYQVDPSSLGSNIITNPGFDSGSNWVPNSGWTISGGKASYSGSGNGSLYQQNGNLISGTTLGKLYQLQYDVVSGGGVYCQLYGATTPIETTTGTKTHYFFVSSKTYDQISFFASPGSSVFSIDNISIREVLNLGTILSFGAQGSYFSNSISIYGNQSNNIPGTSQFINLFNVGGHTYINSWNGGVLKSAIGFKDSETDFYQVSGNFYFVTGTTSPSQFASITPSQLWHSTGIIGSAIGVMAGSGGASSSTLSSGGSTALKNKLITASTTLDNTGTTYIIDPSNSSGCTGTTTYSCSHWTNSGDCTSNANHGGCYWNAGSSCNDFNGDIGNCQSHGTCTADQASCAGPTDQYSCESQDDAYGGSCVFDGGGAFNGCNGSPASCSSWSGDGNEASCSSQPQCSSYPGYCSGNSGCETYSNSSDCGSDYLGFGGCGWTPSVCNDNLTCSAFNGNESLCSAAGCSPSYSSPSCSGYYYTGNCSGQYNTACLGTSSCQGLNQSQCGNESGCLWSSVLNLALPDGESCVDRHYWLKKDGTGTVKVNPYSGQTIEGQSSYTLTDKAHITYLRKTASCLGISEGPCGSTPGCTPAYSSCSWDSENGVCLGGGNCSSLNETDCPNGTYYTGCSGNYTVSKNWYILE